MLTRSQISVNIAAASALEDDILQANSVGLLLDNVDPEGDITMEPPSTIPSPGGNADQYQTPETTKHQLNFATICNPNRENSSIRRDTASEFFGDKLNAVQIPVWVKEATCEPPQYLQIQTN